MIYSASDFHGYPFEKIVATLERIGFSTGDTLYILGDVIDRGDEGIQILKWIMKQDNVKMLLGNHEQVMLSYEDLFYGNVDENVEMLNGTRREAYRIWYSNGGDMTVDALSAMRESEIKCLFDFLRELPVYEELSVNENRFLLCHSGIKNFEPARAISDYEPSAFLWNRPTLEDIYFDDTVTVFGHTPTFMLGREYDGKIIKTKSWIDIDTGAAYGRKPTLLRLDDMKTFMFD